MANDLRRARLAADHIEDPFLRRTVKTGLHLRRYLPFYVFGAIWVLTLATFPSIGRDGDGSSNVAADATETSLEPVDGASGAAGSTETTVATGDTTGTVVSSSGAGASTRSAGRAGPGATSGAGAAGATRTGPPPAADAIQRETGRTRLGVECKPGVRQVPGSSYALPCQNVYDGPNGGATYRGVTDKEIVIVRREFAETANDRAVDQVQQQAGFASDEVIAEVRKVFVDYFNKAYELYGRKVRYIVHQSQNGNSTDEAQSKGKENACLDADEIVKEIKAFAVLNGTQPFSECAAEQKMPVFSASPYFPESYMREHHPYMWNTVMECERIAYQVGEYIGKRLYGKPEKWAGDATLRAKNRYFATYVPDNDGYQRCVDIVKREMKTKYGVTDTGPQYNYQLDVSRFPDQAARASVQFAAAGATTVILACDYISTIVLTRAAQQQNWRPEWLSIGVAANDTDNAARLFDQNQVNGHLFGLSQLGETTKLIGKNSEPGRVYKQATGKDIPEGTTGDYFFLVLAFNLMQSAGPILTPENMARGAMTIPPAGAPDFPAGYWSLTDGPDGTPGAGDHTTIDDSREVFWVSEPGTSTEAGAAARDPYFNGPDGKNGTWKETYGGKRFRNGEWAREDPPIYPPR